jgi:transposase InsO family protein
MEQRYRYWTNQDHLAYFKSKDAQRLIGNKWELLRKIGRDKLSAKAQLRLEWIIFYCTVGKKNVSATATHFTISRKILHKWLKRFNEKDLYTLEDESKAPKSVRKTELTREEEQRVKKLREQHLKLGKRKLQVVYEKKYQQTVSTHKIEQTIRKHDLYTDKVAKQQKDKKRRKNTTKPKTLITHLSKPKELKFGHLWHIDCIICYWGGQRKVIITALEDTTKMAYARVYVSNASKHTTDFLKRLLWLVEGSIHMIHHDNGSEFEKDFKAACLLLEIPQVYSRPRTPKDNPALERFNRTLQEEWLALSEYGLDDLQIANHDLTQWLIHYNSERPHQSLSYLTPLEYAQKNYFSEVLPMYSASTSG